MKYINICLLLTILFLASACSTADTAGSTTTREYDLNVTNKGSGVIVIYTPLDVKASSEQDTKQDTKNSPKNSISPSTALSTPSLAQTGAAVLADSLLQEGKGDAIKKLTAIPVIKPKPAPKPTLPAGEKTETRKMTWIAKHNRSFVWLSQTGASYGGPITLTFDGGCPSLDIPDATKNFADHSGSHPLYFCGTNNKPEESAGILASVFSAPGCKATEVTVHYNK